MKLWMKISLISGGISIYLAFFLIITIVQDKNWGWFFIPLVVLFGIGLIIGIILLSIKLKKKPIKEQKINLKDAKARVIYEMKQDEDNPDNFRVDTFETSKEGSNKSEKTPIVTFYGLGTELNQRRVAIINLNNPKHETSILIDPTKEEIKEAKRMIADNPEEEIKEETTIGLDNFGRPITTTKIRRPSLEERKQEEEKKKIEEVNAI